MANALTGLVIGEVSFCKKGMNPHARVALFKSADPAPVGAQAIAKATFQEALEGNMIAGAVNEAFYQSFDGLWERNDAFRAALSDEFAEGGDGSAASAAYVASVKGLVDEAVASAREAGATAADTAPVEGALEKAVASWLTGIELNKEQTTMNITTKAQLLAEVAKFDPAKTTVADATAIQKAAADLGCEGDLPVALAKSAAPDPVLVRKVAELEMPADVRKHYDGLDEADKVGFIAKSADERQSIVTKANEGDPVVHVSKDGTEIRKSDGPLAVKMAKRMDALEAENVGLKKSHTEGSLETRAAAYSNVAKATAISMLKSVDVLGADTEDGKGVLASLASMNKAAGGVFKTVGAGDGNSGPVDLAKARGDFDGAVAKIADRDKISKSAAMSKARTEEPDLWAAAFPAEAEAAQAAADAA